MSQALRRKPNEIQRIRASSQIDDEVCCRSAHFSARRLLESLQFRLGTHEPLHRGLLIGSPLLVSVVLLLRFAACGVVGGA
jgi:hypothetical protein